MAKPRTLFDKIWDSHLVHAQDDGTCVLYIDRHLIHEVTMHSFQPLIPENAPLVYCLTGFGVFFAVTYIFVRYLEKNEIYLRM